MTRELSHTTLPIMYPLAGPIGIIVRTKQHTHEYDDMRTKTVSLYLVFRTKPRWMMRKHSEATQRPYESDLLIPGGSRSALCQAQCSLASPWAYKLLFGNGLRPKYPSTTQQAPVVIVNSPTLPVKRLCPLVKNQQLIFRHPSDESLALISCATVPIAQFMSLQKLVCLPVVVWSVRFSEKHDTTWACVRSAFARAGVTFSHPKIVTIMRAKAKLEPPQEREISAKTGQQYISTWMLEQLGSERCGWD